MIQFFKQGNDSRCGPITAMNVDSWRGFDVREDELKYYEKALCWHPKTGITRGSFSRWIGQRARRITWTILRDALLNNEIVVICTIPIQPPKPNGHIYPIVKISRDQKHVLTINLDTSRKKTWITRQQMVGFLKRSHCWIVGRV